nr:RB1-inducible coiled-coil protein 1-like isoform X1 [Ipomoea batatas]GME14525.1 RB1-inducible coiled-coil protein 1-like isoform X1 [Ipomoea batatas]
MVGELNETNLQLRAVTTETEENATNKEEEMQNLEKELAEKDALVERLKLELVQTKELNLAEMKKLKEEMELQETIIGTSVATLAENALLKLELHKWRSKAAAAKVAEERSKHKIFTLNGALKLAAASQKESSSRNGFLLEYEQKKEGKIYHSIYLHLLYS